MPELIYLIGRLDRTMTMHHLPVDLHTRTPNEADGPREGNDSNGMIRVSPLLIPKLSSPSEREHQDQAPSHGCGSPSMRSAKT